MAAADVADDGHVLPASLVCDSHDRHPDIFITITQINVVF